MHSLASKYMCANFRCNAGRWVIICGEKVLKKQGFPIGSIYRLCLRQLGVCSLAMILISQILFRLNFWPYVIRSAKFSQCNVKWKSWGGGNSCNSPSPNDWFHVFSSYLGLSITMLKKAEAHASWVFFGRIGYMKK